MPTADRNPLRYRKPETVAGILGHIYDADHPVRWLEVLDMFADTEKEWKTVENTLYDLVAFGALHRIGKPAAGKTPDSRALKPTALGRAWLERELLPLHNAEEE